MAVIQKVNFTGLDLDTELRFMEPGSYRYALNVHVGSSEQNNVGSVENVKGNSLVNFFLPSGTNKVMGSFDDISANAIYYLLYNSNDDHGIYKYDSNSNTIIKIFEWDGLNFQANKVITGIGKIGNILGWTDEYNSPRALDLSKVADYQTPYLEEYISLIKRPPNFPPSVERKKDNTFNANYVEKKLFQFATRFIYEDDSKSTLSPFSKLSTDRFTYVVQPNTNGLYKRFINDKNYIELDLNIDDLATGNLQFMVKKVEVLVREGNTGTFGVFTTLDRSEYTASQIVRFYNNRALIDAGTDAGTKLFDSVPLISGALVAAKNRFFLGDNTEGFDKVTGFSCVTTPQYTNILSTTLPTGEMIFKDRGIYQFGIVFFDKFMRQGGVVTDDSFIARISCGNVMQVNTICTSVNLDLSGTPPDWAYYYAIVRTKNLNQGFFFQTKTLSVKYLRDYGSDGTALYSTNTFPGWIETHLSLKWLAQSGIGYTFSDGDRITVFYQDTASNNFSVDLPIKGLYYGKSTKTFSQKTVSRRFFRTNSDANTPPLTDDELGTVQQSQQIDEFNVVVENFDFKKDQLCFVEIYTPVKRSDTEFFYEIGEVLPIDNPTESDRALSETNITITTGDSYFIARKRAIRAALHAGEGYYDKVEMKIESYSLFEEDFSNNSSDIGRASIVIEEEHQARKKTSIRFSNPFVQETQINGLSSFDAENEEILPEQLGAINKLQAASDNQAEGDVVLAVHEHNSSALYIGIAIIKDNSGKELFANTDEVIGTTRTLRGGYGTLNPESIVQKDGNIYGWDVIKGIAWRYAADGMTPISNYFMKNYFYTKSRNLIGVDGARAYGGFDPYFNEYILTFDNGDTKETVAFNEPSNRWTSFYSFAPESYQKLNTRLISFKDGALYIHSSNSVFNNFYGEQFTSQIKPVCNIEPSKEKILLNIGVESKDIWIANRITTLEGQESNLIETDYVHLANAFSANVLRDINTPNILSPKIPILHGDWMRSSVFEILMENTETEISPLYFANFKVIASERSNK